MTSVTRKDKFHQNVKATEERYQMRWDVNVMAIAGASSENLHVTFYFNWY